MVSQEELILRVITLWFLVVPLNTNRIYIYNYLHAVRATRSRTTKSILRCLLVDDQIFYEHRHMAGVFITVLCVWADDKMSRKKMK